MPPIAAGFVNNHGKRSKIQKRRSDWKPKKVIWNLSGTPSASASPSTAASTDPPTYTALRRVLLELQSNVEKTMVSREKAVRALVEEEFRQKLSAAENQLEASQKRCAKLERKLARMRDRYEPTPTAEEVPDAAAAELQEESKEPSETAAATATVEPSAPETADYFELIRPRACQSIDTGFDYERFDGLKLPLFHEQEAAMDISTLPYAIVSRFVELLPSDSFRLLSYTSKNLYRECVYLRGIDVESIYNDNQIIENSFCECLENGRLLIRIEPEYVSAELRRFFRVFRTASVSLNLACLDPVDDEPASYIIKSYTALYVELWGLRDMSKLDPFLHENLATLEVVMKHDPKYETNVFELVPRLQEIQVTNFSLNLHGDLDRVQVERLQEMLVRYKHPKMARVFLRFTKSYSRRAGPYCWLYEEASGGWILQSKPGKRMPPPSMMRIRRGGLTGISHIIGLKGY